jgi:glyoxylase-like metal-dependent hydrolase (beta-lactamase superfamily II)
MMRMAWSMPVAYPVVAPFHAIRVGDHDHMTEPAEIASALEPVTEGVWHWRIHNAAIGGGISSSHAIRTTLDDGRIGCVLVDPVRLDGHAMQQLPHEIVAVVLTSHGHQRAAWRVRREHGAEVWAPEGSEGLDEEPDHSYHSGDVLPGGLVAIHTPGPEPVHYSLHLPTADAIIVSDLVRRGDDQRLEFVPFEYHDDPMATVASVRHLASLGCSRLLLDHGAPSTQDGASELTELVEFAEA